MHKELWKVGETAYFEYHCWESSDSNDAECWYRSHQPVTITDGPHNDPKPYGTFGERSEDGMPNTYGVRWADGFEYTVFEDELLVDSSSYERPDPPAKARP